MAQDERAPLHVPSSVPPHAVAEWLDLRRALEDAGRVPCQSDDAEAWWPDVKSAYGPRARRAVEACRRCPAADACLTYALAADERFGVWGGTLPEERRALRWALEPHPSGPSVGLRADRRQDQLRRRPADG
jgi:hypothetical protein